MMGMRGLSFRMLRASSMPDMTGKLTSVMTTSNGPSSNSFSASSAVAQATIWR